MAGSAIWFYRHRELKTARNCYMCNFNVTRKLQTEKNYIFIILYQLLFAVDQKYKILVIYIYTLNQLFSGQCLFQMILITLTITGIISYSTIHC